jgi:hypothetical protein
MCYAFFSFCCAFEVNHLGDIRDFDEIKVVVSFPCLEPMDESMTGPL